MSDFALFLGKFLRHGTKIASVAPSSPWLSKATIGNIDWTKARVIVELGAGTGPITRAIAERVQPGTRVIINERDADFAAILRDRFGNRANFEVIEGDACDLATILSDRGIDQVDHIISGLPVPSFPKELQAKFFRVVQSVLAPEGTYNQITEIAWYYQRLYRKYFHDVQFVFEPRNFPPAGAYYCQRPKDLSDGGPNPV